MAPSPFRKRKQLQSGQRTGQAYAKYGSLGLQFAATLLVFGGLGMYLDSKLDCSPWLLITGIFAGFGGGMYSMIKKVPPVADPSEYAHLETDLPESNDENPEPDQSRQGASASDDSSYPTK